MVGVAGGGVGSASGPIRKAGGGVGGGGGGYGPKRTAGGGRGGLAVGFWPDTKSGGGGGGYVRVSGGPGYSTVVEFMRADINRQRNHAAIIIKCGPKSYEFINGGGGGGGGDVPRVPPPPPPPLPPPPPWIRAVPAMKPGDGQTPSSAAGPQILDDKIL